MKSWTLFSDSWWGWNVSICLLIGLKPSIPSPISNKFQPRFFSFSPSSLSNFHWLFVVFFVLSIRGFLLITLHTTQHTALTVYLHFWLPWSNLISSKAHLTIICPQSKFSTLDKTLLVHDLCASTGLLNSNLTSSTMHVIFKFMISLRVIGTGTPFTSSLTQRSNLFIYIKWLNINVHLNFIFLVLKSVIIHAGEVTNISATITFTHCCLQSI